MDMTQAQSHTQFTEDSHKKKSTCTLGTLQKQDMNNPALIPKLNIIPASV